MDWRKRNYYLIYTDPMSYEMRHRFYKIAAPSIKYHSVHNLNFIYDAQELVSCKKEDSSDLEFEFNKAQRNDFFNWRKTWIKLNKEMIGQ